MEQTGTSGTGGVGNTISPTRGGNEPPHRKKYRNYVFTLNNYTEKELEQLEQEITKNKVIYKEIGENGTPHLQGTLIYKSPVSFSYLKQRLPRAHIEKCISLEQSVLYCRKDNNVFIDDYPKIDVYKGEDCFFKELYPWELQVKEFLKETPNNRNVYWIYQEHGNAGKSMFCKYLLYHENPNKDICYVSATKSADILTIVEPKYRTYLIDIPKSVDKQHYHPYNAIEQIKNGLTSDGKLKKKMETKMFRPPHVIFFSNMLPKVEELSMDKWNIYQIEKDLKLYKIDPRDLLII